VVLADVAPGTEPGHTRFVARRIDGDFDLSWWPADRPEVGAPIQLEAIGETAARIDGRSIRWTASLSVRGFGGDFDRFHVRLPEGAELKTSEHPGYTLTSELPDNAVPNNELPNNELPDKKGTGPALVEVRLEKSTAGPVEIRLVAERPAGAFRPDEPLNLAGFEVVEAARQWGHLAVHAVGDWQVLWGSDDAAVRQVSELPSGLRRDDLLAGFEYARQPYSLPARIVAKETRIGVEPEYLFLVEDDEVRLEATWKYTVRGAKAYALEIDLPDWTIDELGPANLVNLDSVIPSRTVPLVVPLLQPSTGGFELTLRAHRPLSEGIGSLGITLPVPRANHVSPAAIVVQAADNVELQPRTEVMTGLARQRVAPAMKLPPRQQPPLFYRGDIARSKFVADFAVLPQVISVDVTSRIDLADRAGSIEQRLDFHIQHEPATTVALLAPRELANSPDLRIDFEGQPLTIRRQGDEADPATLLVDLPGPRIGLATLTMRQALPEREVPLDASVSREIDLLMPRDGMLGRNDLLVVAGNGLSVKSRGGPWRDASDAGEGSVPAGNLRLTTEDRATRIELLVDAEGGTLGEAILVEKAWIQSWLTDEGRVDRAVYRFTTGEPRLDLVLPAGTNAYGWQALLDGKRLPTTSLVGRSLSVPLPAAQRGRRHLLELQYRFTSRPPRNAALFLEAPRLPPAAWVQRTYWQVVLPPNEHLVLGPDQGTSEFAWAWTGWGWGRRSARDQAQLEGWTGAPARASPPVSTNQYVFSSLDLLPGLEIRTADRALVVFTASLAALATGLLMIYVPLARSTLALFVGAVLLIGLSLMFPAPAILLLQAAGLGVVLAAFSGGLDRMVSRRHGRREVMRRASGSSIGRRASDLEPRSAARLPTSTITAPGDARVVVRDAPS
jgi:hypothetical protein